MKRFQLAILLLSMLAICVRAQEKQCSTHANLKAEYEYTHWSQNTLTGVREPFKELFILQMSPDASYFYSRQQHYMDSLEHDPHGKETIRRARQAAYQAFYSDERNRPHEILRQQGFIGGSEYRCFKDFKNSTMKVLDSASGDRYSYDVPTNDIEWSLLDSTKTVLGYQCQLACADYHGRRWIVWFTPDVPVHHGPWQLHGLPGLIMEASTAEGVWSYAITAIQQCDEEFKPTYEDNRFFKSKRKSVLRIKANASRSRSARIAAMTNGAVKPTRDDKEDELMENDYKD